MKTRVITVSLLAVALMAWSVMPALAQDSDTMDPEMAEMMAKWEAIKTPGPQHAMLAKMVGTWDAVAKFWFDPSQPPSEINGTSEFKMIMGGRYLQQNLTADWMGQPMQGPQPPMPGPSMPCIRPFRTPSILNWAPMWRKWRP